jgi:hypothetical protein
MIAFTTASGAIDIRGARRSQDDYDHRSTSYLNNVRSRAPCSIES